MNAIVPGSSYVGLVSCLGALPLSLPLVWAGEQGLKQIWPSGRHVTIDSSGITAGTRSEQDKRIAWSDEIVRVQWYFRLSGYQRGGQERRVPKHWLCLAIQLQQDGDRIIAYAYLSPKKAAALLGGLDIDESFHQISPSDVYGNSIRARLGPPSRPTIPSNILAGRDGHFWLAERRRWTEGYELTAKDFGRFLEAVQLQGS